jgi:hypothetical protein
VRTRQAGESALLLLDVVDVLDRNDIRYAVIGAMAAAVHGVVRASMDADAAVLLPAHRAGEVERECHAAGFLTELRLGDEDDPIGAVLRLGDSLGNRVELLFGLRGLGAEAFARAIRVPFENRELRVIGREDFIAMKLFAHGPQDLLDAENALAVARDSVDLALLRRAAGAYGPDTVTAVERLLVGDSRPA